MLFHRAVFLKNNNKLITQLIKLSIYLIKLKNQLKTIYLTIIKYQYRYQIHDLKELRVGCVLALEGKLFKRTEPRYRNLHLPASVLGLGKKRLYFEFLKLYE